MILCLNAGSSSLKFAMYRMGDEKEELLTSGNVPVDAARESSALGAAVQRVFADLDTRGFPAPSVVGHRLVHGGPAYSAPQRIDAEPERLEGLGADERWRAGLGHERDHRALAAFEAKPHLSERPECR